MKPGKYEVYVLLERDAGNFAKISGLLVIVLLGKLFYT